MSASTAPTPAYEAALAFLRQKRVPAGSNAEYRETIALRDEVYARYQPFFTPTGVEKLTAAEFKSFLYFENNHHWTGLFRLGWKACEDMGVLRAGLRQLFDAAAPLDQRFDAAVSAIPGMGKALASALLVVAFPRDCGVWNNTAEESLRAMGIWPEFKRGASLGERYLVVNALLLNLAHDLDVDLWGLDALHWAALLPEGETEVTEVELSTPQEQVFVLERYLQEFMFSNWDCLALGGEWTLYAPDGDAEAAMEFPTDIGRIDLLARHRTEPRWLVVELKRNQTSDDTVGQVLRYMGWVEEKLAAPEDQVEGLIVARTSDERLRYALRRVSCVRVQLYSVSFSLRDADDAASMTDAPSSS